MKLNRKFHLDGTLPQDQHVLVFGSNLAGRHGAGAAKAALRFGARYGIGVGPVGRTYAIPTKGRHLEILPLTLIEQHIQNFIEFTRSRKRYSWWVTRVGCGYAGYKDHQIAPMFRRAVNCSFATSWQKYL